MSDDPLVTMASGATTQLAVGLQRELQPQAQAQAQPTGYAAPGAGHWQTSAMLWKRGNDAPPPHEADEND